jgi:hypothetical protein
VQKASTYTTVHQQIIKTLLYYDIFNYPLKASEVFRFLGMNSVTEKDVLQTLNEMALQRDIYKFGDLYSVQSSETNILRRIKGNNEAVKFNRLAKEKAIFISRFPFVRAVMASGSLSKDYMDETSDLDFFIVAAPGRLWICRMLLILYKRIFLKNSHKFFCINYFVDTAHLEIEEKNLFTATELATVVPLYGAVYYQQLQQANHGWLIRFFPNYKPRTMDHVPEFHRNKNQKFAERIINILGGDLWEKVCMLITFKYWRLQYAKNYTADDFDVAFKTKSYASKNHPRNFQKNVMERYAQKLKEFGEKFDLV